MSPWQWFCSARTLSNCLETSLTVIALNYWPWHWSLDENERTSETIPTSPEPQDDDYVHVGEGSPRIGGNAVLGQPRNAQAEKDSTWSSPFRGVPSENTLRICLLFAALACILRPTNVLIWISFLYFATLRTKTYGRFTEIRWLDSPIWVNITTLEFLPGKRQQRMHLLSESLKCG